MNKSKETSTQPLTEGLTPKQLQALPLLATGKTGVEVASAINVNPATISQWLNHDPLFRQAYDEYRWEGLRSASAELQSVAQQAVVTLTELMINAKSEQVRLKAAEFILTAIGLNRGEESYREVVPPTPDRKSTGQYDLEKVLDGLGI